MICCLNPRCNKENPSCPDNTEHCTSCGTQMRLLLDRYRPVRRIGTGESAVTYFAQDRKAFVNKDCVIRQLSIQDPKVRELAGGEARRLQDLTRNTVQIPKLLDCFVDNEYLYLVQWFVEGKNLDKYLERHGVFKEVEVLDFLKSLLPVLLLIHKKNIIHRDLRLENIIRRNNGQLVLIDFGVAKQFTGHIYTATSSTPGYTPVEQTNRGVTNPASDLYSLGAACFHLLTGKHPNVAFQDREHGWTNKWRDYLPQPISNELGKIIDKLLKQNDRDRYQSARDVIKAVNRISNGDISGSIGSNSQPQSLTIDNSRNSRSSAHQSSTEIHNSRAKVPQSSSTNFHNSQSRGSRHSSVNQPREKTWLNFNTVLFSGLVATGIGFYPTMYEQYKKINPAKAIEDYTQDIKLKPNDPAAYFHRGGARASLGDKNGAIDDYSQAIEIDPEDADVYTSRGNIYFKAKKYKMAIADYDKSIELNAGDADVFSERGNARSALGDKKGAIEDYTQVIKLEPDRIDGYFHSGIDRANIGDKKGAIADYTQVIKLDGSRADAYFNRANVRLNTGDKKGAIEDLTKAIDLNGNYAEAYFRRGSIRSDAGDRQGGIDDLTKTIDLKADLADAYKNRGYARAQLGDKKGADEDYRQASNLYIKQRKTKEHEALKRIIK
jgi:tetratricopeptide (TPR) repeat protein